MSDCIFCEIADKRTDAVIVYEDPDVLAFMDAEPIREGHCQIIPKLHFETFEKIPADLAAKVLGLGQRLAQKMKDVYKINRVAFLFTGGDIPHAHAHIVPMHEKTDITSARYIVNSADVEFRSKHLRADPTTLRKVMETLRFD
jgi:histidine triad (HIT) family protein